jgi:hypothetical protein
MRLCRTSQGMPSAHTLLMLLDADMLHIDTSDHSHQECRS